ncbi:MAG: hypothetical protein HRT88_19205 [Lentisphaeraceae bacterium]|nr:hypothetical protein [Lentisphaeraceae bacterium]
MTLFNKWDGQNYTGFIASQDTDNLMMYNMAGQTFAIPGGTIKTRKEILRLSMMTPGLANARSINEFTCSLRPS